MKGEHRHRKQIVMFRETPQVDLGFLTRFWFARVDPGRVKGHFYAHRVGLKPWVIGSRSVICQNIQRHYRSTS